MKDLFDSHSHYWDEKLKGQADTALTAFFRDGGAGVINIGTSPETSRLAAEQAKRYPGMYTALGIHPTDAATLTVSPQEAVGEIRSLLLDPANRAVAVGEIGLDYYWEPYDRELQKDYFARQMELAGELGLPVVVHDREAHGDSFEMACRYPGVIGVFHSYSGSAEMALDLIRRGWYISFSGTLTFKNAHRVREVAAVLPHDRVLIETDAPYLTPHPYRGACNHSGYLIYTCNALAQAWGISPEEAARLTFVNACRLFRLPCRTDAGSSPERTA